MTQGGGRTVVAILVLAALLRLACFLVSNQEPERRQVEEDSHGYLALAENLSAGRGFEREVELEVDRPLVRVPELARTPGYPILLALVGKVTPRRQLVVILLQHTLEWGVCVIGALVCRRWFGERAAVVAASLLALDLQGIALSNLVMTESLYGVALFAAAWATAAFVSAPSFPAAVLAGGLIGLTALLRPTSIALPVLVSVALVAYFWATRRRSAMVSALVLGTVGFAFIGAWIVRNGVKTGEYTFSTIPRYNLLYHHAAGAFARAHSLSEMRAILTLNERLGISWSTVRYLPLSESDNRRVKDLALATLREHKGAFVEDFTLHTANMLLGPEKQILNVLGIEWVSFGIRGEHPAVTRDAPVTSWVLLGFQVIHLGLLYVLVGGGIIFMLRHRPAQPFLWVCLGFSVYLLGLSSGSPGDPRLRWPALPLLVMVAASSFARPAERHPS
jgi:hypothetical protein